MSVRERSLATAVFEEPGYATSLALDPDELAAFREAIEAQWITRIRHLHPSVADDVALDGPAGYHLHADAIDHAALWGEKKHRVLPPPDVERLLDLPFVARLRHGLGPFHVADVVYGETIERGRREIYWRIVRPGVRSDVGDIHADHWFHELHSRNERLFPEGARTAKVWIPVHCEPGKNGLAVVPGSHRRAWSWQDEGDHRPRLDQPLGDDALTLLRTEPGTLVVFNDHLLHTGAPNTGRTTRVSAELTLVLEESTA